MFHMKTPEWIIDYFYCEQAVLTIQLQVGWAPCFCVVHFIRTYTLSHMHFIRIYSLM